MQDTLEPVVDSGTEGVDWGYVLTRLAWVMVAWAVVIHVIAQVFIPPVAIFGILYGVGVVLLSRTTGKVAPIFFIVASVALLGGSAPIIAEAVPYPDSPGDFVLSFVVGALVPVAIILTSVAMLRRWSNSARLRIWYGTIGLVVVLTGISFIAAAGVESDVMADGDALLELSAVEFVHTPLTVESGGSAIFIDNKDAIRHTFTIEELGIDVQVPAGAARRIVLPGVAPGTYDFICSITGHENMVGELVVSG